MREDIYAKMDELDCAYLFLAGSYHNNPNIHYLVSTAILFHYFIILGKEQRPLIFFNDMDRDEAEKTGFETINYQELYKRGYNPSHSDPVERKIGLFRAACEMFEISGNVLVHEYQDVNLATSFMQRIKDELPEITIVNTDVAAIFDEIRERKDETEITAIARTGEKACLVFKATEDYLKRCFDKDGSLVDAEGVPVTIQRVKRFIEIESAKHNLLNDMGFIFSQAQDAGLPHHGGRLDDVLRMGETIVFDFGPIDKDSDYVFDMTRSYCLNTAPDHVVKAYEILRQAQQLAEEHIKVGVKLSFFQHLVCDFLEKAGYPTIKSERFTCRGFTHGLGHGIGIEVHEGPNFYLSAAKTIEPGHVFTVEPGLYFPEEGWGLRLEDVIAIHHDGRPENLTKHPKNLILKVKKWE